MWFSRSYNFHILSLIHLKINNLIKICERAAMQNLWNSCDQSVSKLCSIRSICAIFWTTRYIMCVPKSQVSHANENWFLFMWQIDKHHLIYYTTPALPCYSIGHYSDIPTMQFFTVISRNTQNCQNPICYHWPGMSGNS